MAATATTSGMGRARPRLKPLSEQVVVILGASSGIGRETALRFAMRGAKVVSAARSETGLTTLGQEIAALGGQSIEVVCDVADYAQVQRVATAAVEGFGRIDTWVNVAAISVYATFEETTVEEFRRVLDVNLMGYVHGAKAALPHLRQAGGGALICISSVEGTTAMPLHSAYAASKHGIEGLLDALRRELMAEGVPISVTSIRPAVINTPFFNNARNRMDVKPTGPPPVYQPAVVADCVLYAAEHPVRDLYAGGAGKLMALNQIVAPAMMDALLARFGIPLQRTDDPATDDDAFQAPRAGDNRVEGDFSKQARRLSLYTWMETHPAAGRLAAVGLPALAGFAVLRRRNGR